MKTPKRRRFILKLPGDWWKQSFLTQGKHLDLISGNLELSPNWIKFLLFLWFLLPSPPPPPISDSQEKPTRSKQGEPNLLLVKLSFPLWAWGHLTWIVRLGCKNSKHGGRLRILSLWIYSLRGEKSLGEGHGELITTWSFLQTPVTHIYGSTSVNSIILKPSGSVVF